MRYVAWCRRRAVAIVVAHVVAAAAAVYLIAYHLPLYADFSYLLPQDAPAVRDLRVIEARVRTPDIVVVVVAAPTAEARAAATAELETAIGALPRELVARVVGDDVEQRAFLRAHRFLLVPLEDLVAARDALVRFLHDSKLAANPLYIDLEEHHVDRHELDNLRDKRRQAEARLDRSSAVSQDGLVGRLEVRSAFRSTDPVMAHRLIAALDAIRTRVAAAHPGVAIGFTGSVVFAAVEHDAIASGMLMSSIVTVVLVAIVLAMFFRSVRMLALLVVTIAIATLLAFGAAALTIGHLNPATAFLGAVIAGNGINYGIIVCGRFLDERKTRDVDAALAAALAGAARPTLVASLCAAAAYGALAASSFKGFADFAVIGGVGMLLCWSVTFVLLPVLILWVGGTVRGGDNVFGRLLARLLGAGRPAVVVAAAAVVVAVAAVITVRFVGGDPFEYDGKQLRAESAGAIEARHWLDISDRAFGRSYTGRAFIAADAPGDVPAIVTALRARERGVPEGRRAIGRVDSVLDVVPTRQADKLAVLAEIRKLLDDSPLDELDERDGAELADLRPPDDLAPITLATLPASLREPLTEADGRIGQIISIRPADALDDWSGRDMVRFANAVQRVEIAGKTPPTSGASVIFADVLLAIEHDTPVITGLAALGIVVIVLVVVGRDRRAAAVLAATGAGAVLMIATCALLGVRATFLNFIALPITLGLGVDYAINVGRGDRTSGAAVFVCSLTTIIGYGSLLPCNNLAIRGFGVAALVGEVAAIATALVVVPALLALGQRPRC